MTIKFAAGGGFSESVLTREMFDGGGGGDGRADEGFPWIHSQGKSTCHS